MPNYYHRCGGLQLPHQQRGAAAEARRSPLLVRWPEGAARMLVVWLLYVISFLFQALQIIDFTWILHDGAVVSLSSS